LKPPVLVEAFVLVICTKHPILYDLLQFHPLRRDNGQCRYRATNS